MSNKGIIIKTQILAPAIGEVFVLDDKKYKCEETIFKKDGVLGSCEGCVFLRYSFLDKRYCSRLDCMAIIRPDKQNVIFKEI